MGSREEIELAK